MPGLSFFFLKGKLRKGYVEGLLEFLPPNIPLIYESGIDDICAQWGLACSNLGVFRGLWG